MLACVYMGTHMHRTVIWYSHCGQYCGSIFFKKLNTLTITGIDCIAGQLSQRNKNAFSHKNIHILVSSLVCKSSKLETTKISLHRWMVKQPVVQSYNGILKHKTEKSIDTCNNLYGTRVLCLLKKLSEDCIQYDSSYITLSNQQNYDDGKQIIGYRGLGLVEWGVALTIQR